MSRYTDQRNLYYKYVRLLPDLPLNRDPNWLPHPRDEADLVRRKLSEGEAQLAALRAVRLKAWAEAESMVGSVEDYMRRRGRMNPWATTDKVWPLISFLYSSGREEEKLAERVEVLRDAVIHPEDHHIDLGELTVVR